MNGSLIELHIFDQFNTGILKSNSKYDIIIIGAGLGGLVCGYILSKKGYKICILEKNKKIGGTLQNFNIGNCTFSSGMHYLGSLDEGQVLNKLFRYFNILDDLDLKRMDHNGFDRFSVGGKEYAYPMGWDAFQEKLTAYFPTEKEAIKNYVKLIHKVSNSQDVYNLRTPVNQEIHTNKYSQMGIHETLQSITRNIDLQHALSGFNFVYAGDKESTSLYMHALIKNYYVQSAYKLIGGSAQIADLLQKNIIILGGEIFTNKTIEKCLFNSTGLFGVSTTENEDFCADRFISNVHPAVSLKWIEEGKIRKTYTNRILNIQNTISVFGLHIRLKPGSFPILNHNYYHFRNNDVWAVSSYNKDKWPNFYYLYTPAKHGDEQYAECISLYTYMRYDEVEKWSHLERNKRGDAYENWKTTKAERLISVVSEKFPALKESILDWIAVSPLTYRDYIGSPGGAMYGTLRDFHNPMASYVFPRTKIPNLFFTGQNINLHGMLGVSISALVSCGELLGLDNLIKEVNEA